ncbi:LysR family transcriptional regulator [Novosphingobium colocasiae]|uniref:LysR family transcriptional regulator n=1 Tax=Novosphingobium colocasiae TaxID=1256513 RepID=UPI0035B2704D
MSGRDGARSLRAVNLNLLPILRELIRHRSVTLAAEHLNLTQSGVSEALRRLRAQFDDELLVKVGRKMVPTAVALALAPRLEDILGATEDLLKPARFDPADNEREIVIATGDTVSLALAQGLIDRLARHAPRTTVHFVTVDAVTRSDLDEGKIDFLIIPRRIVPNTVFDEEGLDRFTVYWEDWVCIARKDHPRITGALTLELLDELPSIACRLDNQSYLHGALPGRRGPDQIQVSQFTLLPMMVAGSDAVAMVQRHVANWFAAFLPIALHELPIPFPQLEVCAFWSSFHRNDPIHAWLRAELQDIVAQGRSEWLPGEGGFMADVSGGG